MNIVTPTPTTAAFPTANINTEAARRDNLLRDTIPQSTDAEKGASQQGLGSESDRARSPGQPPAPVTYERPQIQSNPQDAQSNVGEQSRDNGSDESAGREDAQERQRQQSEQQEIESLKARDQEVRAHEQAHAATGGQYAGSPRYEYTTGPDNRRYATGGEVSIDISEAQTPEQTLRKMQQVRAAALAPAQPSAQDLKVAAEAAQKAFDARIEISEENREVLAQSGTSNEGTSETQDEENQPAFASASGIESGSPSFDEFISQIQSNATQGTDSGSRSLDIDDELENALNARKGRIQSAYTQAYTPLAEGFSATV